MRAACSQDSTGIQSDSMMCFLRTAMGVRSSGSFLQAALLNCLAPIRDNCITYSDNLVLHGAQQEGLELLDKCFKLLISRRDTFLQVMSAAQACYSASHREIPGLTLALKSSENIIAGASITCFTDHKGLMLLCKHASTNSKMQRYLEFLQSFEPAIKLRWQSA